MESLTSSEHDQLRHPIIMQPLIIYYRDSFSIVNWASIAVHTIETYEGDKEELFNGWLNLEEDKVSYHEKQAILWVWGEHARGRELPELREEVDAMRDAVMDLYPFR